MLLEDRHFLSFTKKVASTSRTHWGCSWQLINVFALFCRVLISMHNRIHSLPTAHLYGASLPRWCQCTQSCMQILRAHWQAHLTGRTHKHTQQKCACTPLLFNHAIGIHNTKRRHGKLKWLVLLLHPAYNTHS